MRIRCRYELLGLFGWMSSWLVVTTPVPENIFASFLVSCQGHSSCSERYVVLTSGRSFDLRTRLDRGPTKLLIMGPGLITSRVLIHSGAADTRKDNKTLFMQASLKHSHGLHTLLYWIIADTLYNKQQHKPKYNQKSGTLSGSNTQEYTPHGKWVNKSDAHLTRPAGYILRSTTHATHKASTRLRRSVPQKGHAEPALKDNVIHNHLHSYNQGYTAHYICPLKPRFNQAPYVQIHRKSHSRQSPRLHLLSRKLPPPCNLKLFTGAAH